MSMLKYVLRFYAFIVVSFASVYAEEGYISFFPDFLNLMELSVGGPAEKKPEFVAHHMNIL